MIIRLKGRTTFDLEEVVKRLSLLLEAETLKIFMSSVEGRSGNSHLANKSHLGGNALSLRNLG